MSHNDKMQIAQNILDRQNGCGLLSNDEIAKVWTILFVITLLCAVAEYFI